MDSVFTSEQIAALNKKLSPALVSTRKGGGRSLRYIEGHNAIDRANEIFGYGNWSFRPLSCEQVVLIDPMDGTPVGISYKAQVELRVRGCEPIAEVGSQPVASWNVAETITSKRESTAKYNKTPVDTSEFKESEKTTARRTITDAHEMAEKGAVTDALKRALRAFGEQFGNGLYGDGRVDVVDEQVRPQPQGTRLAIKTLYGKGKMSKQWTDEPSFLQKVSDVLGLEILHDDLPFLLPEQIAEVEQSIDRIAVA